jgi:hypothetical protein
MNLVDPPLKPSDDLDGLLRAFFRAQMPHPWPSPRVSRFRTTPATTLTSSRRPVNRSRWALAASVGLLLLGSLLLPGRFTHDVKPDSSSTGAHIGSNDLRRQMEKEHRIKQFEDRNKPQLDAPDLPPDLEDLDPPLPR